MKLANEYVLSVTTDRGPGGIATSLVAYSKALGLINVRHKILLPAGAPAVQQLQALDNVEVITCPYTLLKALLFFRLRFPPRFNRLLNDATLIFLHNARLLRWQRFPERTFFICHSGKFRQLEQAKNIIFLTESARTRFVKQRKPNAEQTRLHVIGHGFEDCRLKARDKKTVARPVIVSGGRFVKKKRFCDLIEAARKLDQAGVDCEIVIYGQGPMQSELQSQIDSDNLRNIRLMPWAEDLPAVFRNSDAFCLTSEEEPFGLILGEAMLCELPVIATDTDGPLAMLGTDNNGEYGGYIYRCGNTDELAELLTRLCRDETRRARLGKQARQRILDAFSLPVLAQALESLLQGK